MLKYLVSAACGAAVAVAAIVSCSNSAVDVADAAVADSHAAASDGGSCDCPSAEPPLAGRIVQVYKEATIPPNGGTGATAVCPQGATVLGGGCLITTPKPGYTTPQNGPWKAAGGTPAWECAWENSTSETNPALAYAICLVPPGTPDAGTP